MEEVEEIMSEYTQAIQDVFQDSGATWGAVEDADNIQFLSMYGTEESGRVSYLPSRSFCGSEPFLSIGVISIAPRILLSSKRSGN